MKGTIPRGQSGEKNAPRNMSLRSQSRGDASPPAIVVESIANGSPDAMGAQLRAALSRAQMLAARDDGDGATRALRTVYDRFTEGFETEDLRLARGLLGE